MFPQGTSVGRKGPEPFRGLDCVARLARVQVVIALRGVIRYKPQGAKCKLALWDALPLRFRAECGKVEFGKYHYGKVAHASNVRLPPGSAHVLSNGFSGGTSLVRSSQNSLQTSRHPRYACIQLSARAMRGGAYINFLRPRLRR